MRHRGLWGRSRQVSLSRCFRSLRRLTAGVAPALAAVVLPLALAHAETCEQQAAAKTAELRKQIDQLLRTPDEGGTFHDLGKCTIKALKLGLTLAAPGPTSDRMAKAVETADCLRLKIKQLDTMCYCAQLGADIEQGLDGDALADRMDDVDAAYARMQKEADKDLKKGIRNPVIQKYVESANRYKSCYDKRSLALLNDITASIDAIEIAEGDGAGSDGLPKMSTPSVGAPTVGPPTASANAPTVGAPRPAAGSPGVSAPAPTVNIATATAPATAPSSSSPPAGNCTDLRNDIAAMDAQSNAMPGYIGMRVQLASLYNSLCGSSPAQRTQYWYTADGKQLQPVSAGARPAGAAYAATADIGAQCAGTANPGMCALAAGAAANCQTPPSDLQQSCSVLDGYGDPSATVAATGGQALPDAQLTVGGKTYDVSDSCAQTLARLGDGNASNAQLGSCSGALLDALARAAGAARSALATALGPLLQRGFAPPGAAPQGGFSAAFCAQMENNAQICKTRRDNMATCVPAAGDPTQCAPMDNSGASSGQSGAFNDCYQLYSRFAGMCRMNVNQRPQIAAASLPKSVPPAAKQPAPPPKPNPNAPQASSAPPPKPTAPTMSPKCQQLVSDYVAASQANNGPKALAGYNALKQAGGCGVLARVDKPMPAAGAPSAEDPRFAARGTTSLSDQVIGGCDAAPDVCAARVQQLRAGVSPEAVTALWTHAIGVGLELGGAMANAAALGARVPTAGGPNTNMNSIGNRPVRSTYGQGSPTGAGQQPIHQGCIECRTGTAQ